MNQTPTKIESTLALRAGPMALLLVLTAVVWGVSVENLVAFTDRIYHFAGGFFPGVYVAFAIYGTGESMLRLVRFQAHGFDRTLFAFATGTVALAILLLPFALPGFTAPWTLRLALAIPASYTVYRGLHNWQTAGASKRKLPLRQLPFLLLITLLATCLGALSLTPPLIFDVTEYHVGMLRDYYTGPGEFQWKATPNGFYSSFPSMIELLYHVGVSVGFPADTAPKFLNATFWILAGLTCGRIAKILGGSATLAAALFYLHPVMLEVSFDALIDAPVTCLVLVAILGFIRAADGSKADFSHWWKAACFVAGGAITSKYTVAQIMAGPALVAFAWPALRSSWPSIRARHIGAGIALLLLPLAFFLGRNVAFYGNPLHPFFTEIFLPNDGWAQSREQYFIAAHYPQSPATISYWLTLLPRLREFTWPILACLPLVLLTRTKLQMRALIFCGLSYLLWNLIRQSENRFLLPTIALVIALACSAIASIRHSTWRRSIALILVTLSAIYFTVAIGRLYRGAVFSTAMQYEIPTVTPRGFPLNDARLDFYDANLGSLGSVIKETSGALATGKTLLVFEARPYLIPGSTSYHTVWDNSLLVEEAVGCASPNELRQRLIALGFTHVLVNREELRRYVTAYLRPRHRLELGMSPETDAAEAFYRAQHPEDYFPGFYRHATWPKARVVVLAFLADLLQQAIVVKGNAPLEVYVAPLTLTTSPASIADRSASQR